jgi:hypothetical protein
VYTEKLNRELDEVHQDIQKTLMWSSNLPVGANENNPLLSPIYISKEKFTIQVLWWQEKGEVQDSMFSQWKTTEPNGAINRKHTTWELTTQIDE